MSFDPNITISTSTSVVASYPSLTVNGIKLNGSTANYPNSISAMCQPSSSSNITYTNGNTTTEFKASQMWIVGQAQGSQYSLQQVNGVQDVQGELIIYNTSTNGDNGIYMCYLLVPVTGGSSSQTDQILQAAKSGNSQQNVTVNLTTDVTANLPPSTGLKYIVYNTSTATVIVCTTPIYISSNVIFTLQNNLGLFDTTASQYLVVSPVTEGSWMECDYVPLDSEEVASYSLPLSSGLVQDSSMFNSFKTIILFMVFMFFCIMAYLAIPPIYGWAARLLFDAFGDDDDEEKKKALFFMDAGISAIIGGLAILLIGVGAFGPANSNSGPTLMAGFCFGLIYLIAYVIIQVKKMGGNFPDGVDYNE
jgi:hypothetical protein